jgi:protein-S-isoprenylcysteine O-methyltransferase Ste14
MSLPVDQVTRPPTPSRTIRTIVENVTLGVFFTIFAIAAFQSWRATGHVQMLLLALQETLIIGLAITRRRPKEASDSGWDITIALVGTALPLFQRAGGLQLELLRDVGIAIQVLGTALSLYATWSLGRSFGVVAANRGVQTKGLYGVVRHPLYASYLVGYIGFILGNLSVLNILVVGLSVVCQVLRAQSEERVLRRDPAYVEYAARVRHRFIPFVL